MMLLLGAVALLFASPRDTTTFMSTAPAPPVRHTPAVAIKTVMAADSIVVEKGKRTLTLFAAGQPIRTYAIALGPQPVGDKVKIGDGRTPEGLYHIDFKKEQSRYHMALHISYPDAAHSERASKLGVSPGGDIMVHGLPPGYMNTLGAAHAQYNWTEGCIAVTDREIEEIWAAVPTGAPIDIKP